MKLRAAVGLLLVVLAGLSAASAQAAKKQTRYSLVHGCYSLSDAKGRQVPGAFRARFQATDLGRYLLYLPDHSFFVAGGKAAQPSSSAVWLAEGQGKGIFVLRNEASPNQALQGNGTLGPTTGPGARLKVAPTKGCAVYPEAPLDAKGKPAKAATSYGKVGGILEGHMHWMSYQYLGGNFHCGKPWDQYGIRFALPDCSSVEGPQGSAAPFQNTLNYGAPAHPHDTSGYPKFTEWSKDNLTYEGNYWRWVERAYMGGLRLMVMGVNENRVLCELQANRKTNCNEMDTVRDGFKALRRLQRYADAQAGGPGKGFFQIVTNPYAARKVIAQGRMAVVLEIEVSELFDCRNLDAPTCNQASVDKQLDEMYGLGVRSMLLLNKFDNPLVGVRFDEGPTGVLINAGNKDSAGSFWSAKTCTGKLHDNTIYQPTGPVQEGLGKLLQGVGLNNGTAPAYPPAPHCNTRGLTALGRHVVDRMMDKHMIVNPDHMSQAGVAATLTELEKRRYSGVISPHGWMDPGNWPRLWRLGGLAFPGHSSATSYVKEWKQYRPRRTPYDLGWGYGADLGGLSHQPGVEGTGSLKYPFKSYDGKVTLTRQKTGDRTFDYAKEGVSQYGLYADWFADLRRLGGTKLRNDMYRGAEAYLEMWERADGIKAPGCAPGRAKVSRTGLRRLKLGVKWTTLLRSAGQPQARSRAWSWCVKGKGNNGKADVAELSKGGRVELVGSTARGRSVRGIRVGSGSGRSGTRVIKAGKARYVVYARGGRVRAVGVATRALARRPKMLRAAVARLLRARASQAARAFVPSAATAATQGRTTGVNLAGTGNPQLDAALVRYCRLQLGH
jgi:hypothetical protein